MFRIVGGVLLLLLAQPGAGAADDPKDKPEEQYKALLKEYNNALQEYFKAVREAKTPQDQQKVFQEKYPRPDKYAPKFLELAEKNPKAPYAEDALIWIVTNGARMGLPGGQKEQDARGKAIDMLLRDHVASPKMSRIVRMLGSNRDKKSAELLRALLDKNPSKEVKAEACLALAREMQNRVTLVKQLKENPQLARSYEPFYGKDSIEELRKADPAKLESETKKLYAELTEKYIPDMKTASVVNLCQQLRYSNDSASEKLLRSLYTKDKRDEVRGVACLILAQVLKQSADRHAALDPKAAEKARKESEELFEMAANKYADVKMAFSGTVGKKAKSELFDLRHLSVGKPAPEIQGVDQDGKTFKLSDYKGKVVLLDFWSEF
ncbi:MAG: redoxin domain-containing protein [Planctomycetes bacterium]|nr:redoxin domain-containing protein [Planctomycetota bacterium]